MILGEVKAGRSFFRFLAAFSRKRELFTAELFARRTNDGAVVKPIVLKHPDVYFLSRMKAFKRVI
jgi:hypothetical protein